MALVAVPVLLVGTWSVKNAVLFGTPTTSSWMGMNLAKMTLEAAPPATIQQLVDTGTLTTLALVPPFQSPDAYVPRFARELPRTGVPALDERYKIDTQTSFLIGSPNPLDSVNYNNKVYVVVSKDYLRDDIAFIKAKPRVYLHAVGMGAATFFASADQYIFFMKPYSANWDEIGGYTKLYDTLVEWQPKTDRTLFYSTLAEHKTPSALTHSYFAIAAFVLTILMVPFMVKSRRRDPAFRWTLAFVWVTVVYATAVSCLVELGENNRFRFELGPLPTIAAVALVVELARSFRARRRHGSPSGEDAGGV